MVVSTVASAVPSTYGPKIFPLTPNMAIKMLQRDNLLPDYMIVYSTLQTISKFYKNEKDSYFVYFVQEEKLWIIIKDSKWKHITMCCKASTKLSLQVFAVFDQLYRAHSDVFDSETGIDFHGLEKCYEKLEEWSAIRNIPLTFNGLNKTYLYFLKPESIPKMLKEDISPPEDYEVVDVDPEKHGELILKTLAAREDYSEKFRDEIMFNLENMSSVAIKPKSSNETKLASWVLQDPAGEMRCQYTFPEHRRKSLGNYCLKRLCQKTAKNGYFPYFEVLPSNVNALNFDRLYPDMAWQRWDEENETPVITMISVPLEWLINATKDVSHQPSRPTLGA